MLKRKIEYDDLRLVKRQKLEYEHLKIQLQNTFIELIKNENVKQWQKDQITIFLDILSSTFSDFQDIGRIIRDSENILEEKKFIYFTEEFNVLYLSYLGLQKTNTSNLLSDGCVFKIQKNQKKLIRQSNANFIKDYFFPINMKIITKAIVFEQVKQFDSYKTVFELFSFDKQYPILKLNCYLLSDGENMFLSWEEYSSSRGITVHLENLCNKDYYIDIL